MTYWSVDAAGNTERRTPATSTSTRPRRRPRPPGSAGRRRFRLDDQPRSHRDAERERRLGVGRLGHVLHARRQRSDHLRGRLHRLRRRSAPGRPTGRSTPWATRRRAHRLREHRHDRADDDRRRPHGRRRLAAGATPPRRSPWRATTTPAAAWRPPTTRSTAGPRRRTRPVHGVTQGSHPITFWSVDAVGNAETASTGYVNIDLTAPTVGSDADGAWHNGAVTVHLRPDRHRRHRRVRHAVPPAGHRTWSAAAGNAFVVPAPADHSGDGAWTYEYRALDVAGNASPPAPAPSRSTPATPTTTATGLQADNHSGWRNAAQTVTLAAHDGRLRRHRHLLHPRQRRPADLQRALHARVAPGTTPSSTGRPTRPATPRPATAAT